MRDFQVILAKRPPRREERMSDDQFWIDFRGRTIWRGHDHLYFAPHRNSLRFQLVTYLLCAPRELSTKTLADLCYGERYDGGPLNAERSLHASICQLKPLLRTIGLDIAKVGYQGYYVNPLPYNDLAEAA